MSIKRPAMCFPERQGIKIFDTSFTIDDLTEICNLNPILTLVDGFVGFCTKHRKTKELGKRLDEMAKTVDTQCSEEEKQVQIKYVEMAERLKIELEEKKAIMELELKKTKIAAENAGMTHQLEFEAYFRTSEECRIILENIKPLADHMSDLLKAAEEDEIAKNNKYYVQIGEKYRRVMRQIEKLSKIMI